MTSKQLEQKSLCSGTAVGPVTREMIVRAKARYYRACVATEDWNAEDAGWEDFIPEARAEVTAEDEPNKLASYKCNKCGVIVQRPRGKHWIPSHCRASSGGDFWREFLNA